MAGNAHLLLIVLSARSSYREVIADITPYPIGKLDVRLGQVDYHGGGGGEIPVALVSSPHQKHIELEMNSSLFRQTTLALGVIGTIAACSGTLHAQPSDTAKLENLGSSVNSRYDDVGPVISPDGKTLYFDRTDDPSNYGNDDIWSSTLGADGTWTPAKNIGPPLNNADHNFVSSVTPDGNTLLLGNVYNPDGTMGPGVSVVHRGRKGWGAPEKLNIRNYYSLSLSANYYLGSDGNTLLMAIERNDSRGDLDLYVSFRQPAGDWSEPMNLGGDVNTRGADRTPFLAADGVSLYFASDGHGGFGSSDIFVTRRLDSTWRKWSKPENLGKPINTDGWDGFFTIPASGDYAYLVSAQNSLGSADIYRVRLRETSRPRPVVLVSGRVLDARTREPLAAQITYAIPGKSGGGGSARTDPATGSYKITLPAGDRYTFTAEAEGYSTARDNIDLSKVDEYKETTRDFLLKGGKKPEAGLADILFQTGSTELSAVGRRELDRVVALMKGSPAMRLEIAGHTDDLGEEATNQELSEQRAAAVAGYLKEHGIEESRLSVHGYGEQQPAFPNSTPSGRSRNRRVSFTKRM